MMRHVPTILRGLGALAIGLMFVIAVPTGLITYVGWPLPTALPTIDRIQLALRSGIDPQLLINTLAVVVWIVWFQIVIVLAAEVVAAIRGKAAARLLVLPGLQPAVAQLVAAVTLAVTTLGPLRAVPATASPLPEVALLVSTHHASSQDRAPTHAVETSTQHQRVQSDLPTHQVGRHDTLWRIAETSLGDGRRWTEIRDLNTGRTMSDGHSFTKETDRLTPGWTLLLPADAAIPDTEQSPQAGREVTVDPGDNFWTIAETALETAWGRTPSDHETADYWRRLIDTNRDRLLPPHDPNLIFPGQRFELPPIPTTTTTEPAPPQESEHTETTAPDEVTVTPGDSFWSIAEATLTVAWDRTPTSVETASYWRQLVDTNRDRLLPPHDPNLIHPGQILTLPPIPDDPRAPVEPTDDVAEPPLRPVPSPVSPGEPPATETPSAELPPVVTLPLPAPETSTPSTTLSQPELPQQPDRSAAAETTGEPDARPGRDLVPIASTLAGLGILAASLVALLRRLRGAQLRHRRPGTIPMPAPADTTETETTIRTASAPDSAEFIDLALRAVAHDIVDSHGPAPDVVGVHLTAEKLRLLLWTPRHDPPPGWSVDDDGRSWTVPTGTTDIARLRQRTDGIPAPYPALVTAGHGDRALLLLDLEYLGATQITGDPDDVASTCYTMATELAASPTADGIEILCVGFGADLADLERVRVVEHLDEILPLVEAKAEATAGMASPSNLHGRIASPGGDTWDPIVVFDPAGEPPDGSDRLLTIAHAGRAVAAVVGYPTGSRWRLHIADNTVRIEPLGASFARRNLTPTEQTAIGDLVATAKDLEGLPPELTSDPLHLNEAVDDTPPVLDEPAEVDEPGETDAAAESIPKLKLLGALRVDGIDTAFPLRRSVELLTYLALHRNGVEADMLMEALWPEQPPDNRRLNRHCSLTRTTLGTGPDGEYLLPYVTGGIYRLSPHLRSDLEDFTAHVRQADRATGDAETQHLQAALDLVEGTPFTGAGNAYTWAHTEGIITHAIVAVDNAAHRLAQLALMHDDPEQAAWTARKGLIATGVCEECYRNLMRAAIAEGNQVALEALYAELLGVIDADEGPDASTFLDPETVELYEQLTRNRRRQVG